MYLSNIVKRELYVARHGQSATFRKRKWVVILVISSAIWYVYGAAILGHVLIWATITSLCTHFLYRYMTSCWKKPWGFYRPIPTPYD